MAGPLLYPTLRDAKYVNQFVGSTFPELKEMRQALIERWDAAKETDSKAKALALDVLQNAHPSNLETAKKVYEASQEKFKKREETGNYEDLLPQTLDDARMLGVNVAKLSKNKQLIEDFQKKVTADPNINAKRKKEYFENVFTPNVNANTLDFDKETGVVTGNYFVEPPIQKDFDVAGNLDKFFTGMKSNANKTAIGTYRSGVIGNDGKLRPSKPGEQEYVFKETTSGGWEQITLDEVGYIAQNYLKGNSDFNAYDAARRVEKVNLKLIEIDKSNLPPDEKEKRKKVILDAAGKEFEDEEVTPTIEAIKSKYAYKQTSNAYDLGVDTFTERFNTSGAGLQSNLTMYPQHGNGEVIQGGESPKPYDQVIKELEEKNNTKPSDYNKKRSLFIHQKYMNDLPDKMIDPLSKKEITKEEYLIKKGEHDDRHRGNPRFANPYTFPKNTKKEELYGKMFDDAYNYEQSLKNKKLKENLTIDELAKSLNNPGLISFSNKIGKGVSTKDTYEMWTDYFNKIRTSSEDPIIITPEQRLNVTTMILGSDSKKGDETSRSGGLFDNHPVEIIRNGVRKSYDNGNLAVKDGAITRKELSKLNVTERSTNYFNPKLKAPYISSGVVGDNSDVNLKVKVAPTKEIVAKELPIFEIEQNLILGKPFQLNNIVIDGKNVNIYCDPFKNLSIDKSKKKVSNVDPYIKIDFPGTANDWEGFYSYFKPWFLSRVSTQNLTQDPNYTPNLTNKPKKSVD